MEGGGVRRLLSPVTVLDEFQRFLHQRRHLGLLGRGCERKKIGKKKTNKQKKTIRHSVDGPSKPMTSSSWGHDPPRCNGRQAEVATQVVRVWMGSRPTHGKPVRLG